MSAKKVFFVMLGVLLLITAGGIGSLVLGNLSLQKKSDTLVALKLNNRLLEEQQLALQTAKKNVEKYADIEKIAHTVVPQDKDQAEGVREIIDIAAQSGISIRSITFPSSTLGAAVGPSAAASKSVSQAVPVLGIPGVLSLAINITPDDSDHPVTYYQFLDFLTRLENNRRTAQVTDIKITPVGSDNKNPVITFSLTINTFIKP